ncbi:MAG: RDD family protein [Acidobacteria bacterium]|nr:MAG: RDD family protein [Acidobacteriota bacterium]
MADEADKLTIETPELVPLDFPLAGIGSRFLAVAMDFLIQLVVSLSLVIVGMLLAFGFSLSDRGTMWLAAMGVLAYFLLQFVYFAGFEALWNGQTLGKRQMHLRVIKDSGRPITVYDAVARNLLRIVDSLPGFYGVGIVSMLLSSKNQRLGDFVAGTVVVHEQPLADHAQGAWTSQPAAVSSSYDPSALTAEEYQLMEAFLVRREQLPQEVRLAIARRVMMRIGVKLKISELDRQNPETLIEKLANEYRNRAQFR